MHVKSIVLSQVAYTNIVRMLEAAFLGQPWTTGNDDIIEARAAFAAGRDVVINEDAYNDRLAGEAGSGRSQLTGIDPLPYNGPPIIDKIITWADLRSLKKRDGQEEVPACPRPHVLWSTSLEALVVRKREHLKRIAARL